MVSQMSKMIKLSYDPTIGYIVTDPNSKKLIQESGLQIREIVFGNKTHTIFYGDIDELVATECKITISPIKKSNIKNIKNEKLENIISCQQLQAMLAEKHGAKIVSLVVATIPDMLVKNNPYYKRSIIKISKINGIVNWNYSRSVNNQREREGKEKDFTPAPRKWGTKLSELPFVSHVTKDGSHNLYLEVKVESVLSEVYKDGELIIPLEDITPYLRDKKSVAIHQGLDREVVCRDYNVKNILSITIDKQIYQLINN